MYPGVRWIHVIGFMSHLNLKPRVVMQCQSFPDSSVVQHVFSQSQEFQTFIQPLLC